MSPQPSYVSRDVAAPASGELVVRLLSGEGSQREMSFAMGRPAPFLSVGARGAWKVLGRGVAPIHVVLAFNGQGLFACVRSDVDFEIDGERVTSQGWVPVPVGAMLQFGAVRLAVLRRVREGSAPTRSRPSSTWANTTQIVPPHRAAPAPAGESFRSTQIVPPLKLHKPLLPTFDAYGSTRIVPPLALLRSPPPSPPSPPSPPLARTINSLAATRMAPPTTPHRVAPSSVSAVVPLEQTEASGARQRSDVADAYTCPLPPSPEPRSGATVFVEAWRSSSLAKKAIVVLLVPAFIAALASLRGNAAHSPVAKTQRPVATASATLAAKPSATPPAPTAATVSSVAKPAAPIADSKTAERRALDAVASGARESAAEQYAALAKANPDNLAFAEAVRILRQRASEVR
jgi:hypothetical protein